MSPESTASSAGQAEIFHLEDMGVLRRATLAIIKHEYQNTLKVTAPENPQDLKSALKEVNKRVCLAILDFKLNKGAWAGDNEDISTNHIEKIINAFPNAVICFASGSDQTKIQSELAQHNLVGTKIEYLPKPFSAADLIKRINQAVTHWSKLQKQ